MSTTLSQQQIVLTCKRTLVQNDFSKISCNLPDDAKVDATTKVINFSITDGENTETITYQNSSTALKLNAETMTEEIPQDIGLRLQRIQKFSVTNSQLKFIKRSDFTGMGHLIELNLGSNQIENIPYDAFHNITNLEILYLNDNNITHLKVETLMRLPNLKLFNIEFNKIQRLEAGTFRNNKNLQEIFLNNNDLKYIHENFLEKINVEIIDLRRNFEFCRNCHVIDNKELNEMISGCERDRYYFETEIKEQFEICVDGKTSEAEHIPKTLDECKAMKKKENSSIYEHYEKCLKDAMSDYSRETRRSSMIAVDTCIYKLRYDEEIVRRNFEACVNDKTSKNSALKTLLGKCYEHQSKNYLKSIELYNSCVFCKAMSETDNINKCEMRFFKYYGDDIIKFQEDVNKYFGLKI